MAEEVVVDTERHWARFNTHPFLWGLVGALLHVACFLPVDVRGGEGDGAGGAEPTSEGGTEDPGQSSTCGDGEVTGDEACDDGLNAGDPGGCNPDCTRTPYCGDQLECDAQSRHFRINGGHLVSPIGGQPWPILAGGCMSWRFHDVQPQGSTQVARYEVTAFRVEVEEPSVATHTLTVVPDGQPSPGFSTGDPTFEPDSGLVSVLADTFLDVIFFDLSVDGQPVDPTNTMGGPAWEAAWAGTFPEVDTFAFTAFATLQPWGHFPELTLTGAVMPCAE